jgi:hypothetical protein
MKHRFSRAAESLCLLEDDSGSCQLSSSALIVIVGPLGPSVTIQSQWQPADCTTTQLLALPSLGSGIPGSVDFMQILGLRQCAMFGTVCYRIQLRYELQLQKIMLV